MPPKPLPIVALSDMIDGQEADLFVLMTSKEELKTRDGKPYFRIGFRDARREVQFPIWSDSPWGAECRDDWTPGLFYKLRATYRESNYGPQLDIRKIRATTGDDRADGFDPAMLQPCSRFDPQAMFDEMKSIASEHIDDEALRELVVDMLSSNKDQLLTWAAAKTNHHAFVGGYLEHVLSVTRTCIYLADKYDDHYPDLVPRLDKSLVVAGAILHDIGKLRELQQDVEGSSYTATGHLIGHILQGRDMIRETALGRDLDPEMLLRLEHIVVSHQRLPEWGSPKPPMTPEALIVHYADDLDAKYHMMVKILESDSSVGPVTSRKNILQQSVFRGLE